MEINSIPAIPPTMDRTTISNTAHVSTEADVHQDSRQPPVLPVAEVATQTHGNDTSTERKVEWARKDRRPIYRVVERESGEVLSQTPSDQALHQARNIEQELHRDDEHAAIDVRS